MSSLKRLAATAPAHSPPDKILASARRCYYPVQIFAVNVQDMPLASVATVIGH